MAPTAVNADREAAERECGKRRTETARRVVDELVSDRRTD
jgi:hypothetical protein